MTDIRRPDGDDAALRGALAKEPLDIEPPPELEDRTVAGLREEGLIGAKESPAWRRAALIIGALAVAALLFIGGLFAGGALSPGDGGDGPRYALLLYGASTGDDVNAAAARTMEYDAWGQDKQQGGRVLRGEVLSVDGALLRLAAADSMSEGGEGSVAGPAGEELSGYVVITAESMDDAVRFARQHPHLKHGGTIVVRHILTL